jgi:hypothetical protein
MDAASTPDVVPNPDSNFEWPEGIEE